MGFTNPTSTVSATITGGTVGLQAGATVGIDPANDGVSVAQGDTNAVTISALPVGALGSGSDGTVTVSATLTLTRDMQYVNLTNNGTINTASYVIRATGTVDGVGTFQNAGGSATGATPGAGAPTGSMAGGTNGATGLSLSAAQNNVAATLSLPGLASNSPNADIQGGTGGTGGSQSVPAGQAGAPIPTLGNSYTPSLRIAGGSGGSSGGYTKGATAGTTTSSTGAGGGAGGPIVIICATYSFTGIYITTGGNGGNGVATNNASTGGGGGGGGGGPVMVVYLTNATTTTLNVTNTGGSPGTNATNAGGVNNTAPTSGDSATSKPFKPAVRFL